MYKKLLISISAFLLIMISTKSQSLNKDSLQLVSKVNSDRAKVAKLQSHIADEEKKKSSWAEKAQESADKNRKSADALSMDPQNKRLARRAKRHARLAKKDAKKARKAVKSLDRLIKKVRIEQDKTSKDESKLKTYIDTHGNLTPPLPSAPLKDSVGN